MLVQVGDDVGAPTISILEQLEPTMSFCEFLIIERVDIFEVAIQGEEEFCRGRSGNALSVGF